MGIQIIRIIDENNIEIKLSDELQINNGDILEVIGNTVGIHPATGQVVERFNQTIGKVFITDIKQNSATAIIIEKFDNFSVGNNLIPTKKPEKEIIDYEDKLPIKPEESFKTQNNKISDYLSYNYSSIIHKKNVSSFFLAFLPGCGYLYNE